MGLFLFRFWPVLIPLIVYLLWLYIVGRKAKKAGQPGVHFLDGPWYWVVITSLVIGIGCFMLLATSLTGDAGEYIPPHMQKGVLVPGQVVPKHEQ